MNSELTQRLGPSPAPGEGPQRRSDRVTTAEAATVPTAFETFFVQNRQQFLRFAVLRLRDPHDADEAVMDAVTTMFRKWDDILRHEKPMALAYTILNHAIQDHHRRTYRWERTLSLTTLKAEQETSHTERSAEGIVLGLAAANDLLVRIESALTQKQYEVFTMRAVHDLSVDQISAAIGVTPSAVRHHLSTARRTLQSRMSATTNTLR
ncbi:RNA polymerase sigma factor [Streptomyces sp. Tue6028]|uniref:RNA polymerase sigma factor n=1 Tax=Streptomyces sp. Tue6028 TaxID=2036037 RepID=UPI003EBAA5D2